MSRMLSLVFTLAILAPTALAFSLQPSALSPNPSVPGLRHAALSTQHSALSTQPSGLSLSPSARSAQHSALIKDSYRGLLRGLQMSGGMQVQYDEDEEAEDDDDEDVPLAVRMDALRRMQAFKAKKDGQMFLKSGRISLNEIPLEVECEEARDMLKEAEKEEILLLDVREQQEHDFCRIDGAVLIPMSEMKFRSDEVPKDKPVLVYCHHGVRSMQVVRYLRSRGWKKVTNIEGGIEEWSSKIDPKIPKY